ncbi:MAG: hypothetical protein LBD37_03945 [Treponema sp.]|jgi:hypothetical protein|nr:hypothetical protein [Treponema sp.]
MFKKTDILVILFCLSGVGGLLFLFYQDINRSLSRQSEKPVGVIIVKRNIAQRRFVDRVLWDRLQKSSSVYNGDYIRTAALSEATLFLDGVGEFDITENTLLQIAITQNQAGIALSQGSFSVNTLNTGGVCQVSAGAHTAALNPGAAAVFHAVENGDIQVWLTEGTAAVFTQGRRHDLRSGDILALPAGEGVPSRARLGVRSPKPSLRLVRNSREPVPVLFSFQPYNFEEGQHINLEIAANRRFSSANAYRIERDTFTVELAPGNYWWRAYPSGLQTATPHEGEAERLAAGFGSIGITYSEPPVLLNPPPNAHLRLSGHTIDVLFRWTAAKDASAYTIELADNPLMRDPFMIKQVENTFFLAQGLGENQWYWRIRPVFPDIYTGEPAFSSLGAFSAGRPGTFIPQDGPAEAAPETGSLESETSNAGTGLPGLQAPNPARPSPGPAERPPSPAPAASQRPAAAPAGDGPSRAPADTADAAAVPPPLAAPRQNFASPNLQRPPDNYVLTKQRMNRPLVLSWKAIKDADLYMITLYRETSEGALVAIRNTTIRETRYAITDLSRFSSGTYVWTIEAVKLDGEGQVIQRGSVEGRRFIIPNEQGD